MDLHHEDALKFLMETLAGNAEAFVHDGRPPSYDVWLPNAVGKFLRAIPIDFRGDPEFFHRPEFESVWLAFYDAAWQLCRRGIFRLSQKRPEGRGSGAGPLGDGYSITRSGAEWLKNSTLRYFPTAPARYVSVLAKPAKVLGEGFLQRGQEAADCYESENHLAACAMCGAAAESVLLAIAVAKVADEGEVLKRYKQSDGRRNVMRLIFDPSKQSLLERRLQTGFNLLAYWRDETAHGRFSTIGNLEAYDALGRLLHLSFLAWDNWQELTGRRRLDG
jgi:hypothetical protein